MGSSEQWQIVTFYRFKRYEKRELARLRDELRELMRSLDSRGTLILAEEGFNSTVALAPAAVPEFIAAAEQILSADIPYKSSFHRELPFRRIDVKIKPEIVTLKKPVDIKQGEGTHVSAAEWNELITDPETLVLDTRNGYEFRAGTFRGAVNPKVAKFSDLPAFVDANLDKERHKRVAMFCTGGIRCEKFAPYLKGLGFESVFQLDGGILKYLESVGADDSLWQGECFVFDDRVTVDHELRKGVGPDLSLESLD